MSIEWQYPKTHDLTIIFDEESEIKSAERLASEIIEVLEFLENNGTKEVKNEKK